MKDPINLNIEYENLAISRIMYYIFF